MLNILVNKLNLYETEVFNMLKTESQKPELEFTYILVQEKPADDSNRNNEQFKLREGIQKLCKHKLTMMQIIENLEIIHSGTSLDNPAAFAELEPQMTTAK